MFAIRRPQPALLIGLAALLAFVGAFAFQVQSASAADAVRPSATDTAHQTSYCSVSTRSETRVNYRLYEWNPPFPPVHIGWNVTDWTITDYSAPEGGIDWLCDGFDSETPGATYNKYK